MIKEKKGYSLTVLIVTIAVILIITTTAVISIRNIDKDRDISKFMADLTEVKQFVIEYYAKNNALPILDKDTSNVSESFLGTLTADNKLYQISEDDVGEYYNVDLDLLGKIHLNDKNRGYILNEGSLNIYVEHPFNYNGENYYTLTRELTQTDIVSMENYAFKLNVTGNPVTWATEAEILVSVTDLPIDEGITWNFKWMEGTHTASDFNTDSVDINNFIYGDTFTLYKNGIYTVFAENPSGEFVTRNIVISKIDDIPPRITYEDGKITIDDPETGVAKLRCKIKESTGHNISTEERNNYPEYYTMAKEDSADTAEDILENYLWGDRNIKGDSVQNYLSEYEKYYDELTTYNSIIANSEATSGELQNASKMIKQLNDSHPQFAHDNETFSNDERNIVLYVEDLAGNATVYSALTRKELSSMQYVTKTENLEGSKAVINNNNATTATRDVKISLSSPYADYYFITEERGATPVWKPFDSRIVDYELSDGDGEKIVYIFFKDASGNVKSTAKKITLDTNM